MSVFWKAAATVLEKEQLSVPLKACVLEKVKVLGKERKTVAELAPGWELRMDFELGLLTEAKRALGLVLSLVVL